MNVRLPSNTNDEYVTPTGITKKFPLDELTTMTAFHYRIKLADVCRQVVDAMPAFDDEAPAYETVLAMDKKFQDLLNSMPVSMRIDTENIAQSAEMCKTFPALPLLRAGFHLSVQTRLCRLHRPYHLEGLTNKKYAYSHSMCLRAAQAVLDTRSALDDAGKPLGVNPARSWVVMQHVFVAGLILATDVSFNPSAPDSQRRKAKVLAICDILEKSIDESGAGMEGVQRNLQTLISTLQGQGAPITRMDPGVGDSDMPNAPVQPTGRTDGDGAADMAVDFDFDQLWNEFMAIAPDLEVPQWDMVFGDMNAAVGL